MASQVQVEYKWEKVKVIHEHKLHFKLTKTMKLTGSFLVALASGDICGDCVGKYFKLFNVMILKFRESQV